jgi:methionyl-tRNA formyltransferase
MLKIAFCLYRQWGLDIFKEIEKYQKLRGDFKIGPVIVCKDYEFKKPKGAYVVDPNDTEAIYKILKKSKPDIVCMYSWSWIVREPILSEFICLCIHPSLVPENRGGTPIQNQMILGIKDSGVSLFKMDKGIDSGPLYKQTVISFRGNVHDIFKRMVDTGSILTKELISNHINGTLKFKPQKVSKSLPALKRRTPEMSEIKIEELPRLTFEKLNNLVRGLLPPYPTAFIKEAGKTIYIEGIEKYPKKPIGKSYKIKDGWVRLTKYKIK